MKGRLSWKKSRRARGAAARTRSLAFVGLSIAIMAVSAWVTVPLGPVPFTLQMFALVFAIVVLTPRECIAAVTGYLLLGAVGLPVFSGMRGGIGVLAGPTGGFLWGYLLGAAAAALLLWVVRQRVAANAGARGLPRPLAAAASRRLPALPRARRLRRRVPARKRAGFCASPDSSCWQGFCSPPCPTWCGWAQFMAVAGVGPEAAFVTAIAPFVVIDVLKVVAAVLCARAVRAAVR